MGTENPSLGFDIFWVLGPTMDKIYFLQNLKLSNENSLLSHLRKNLRMVTEYDLILIFSTPWGRQNKKIYPLKHVRD